MPEPKEMGNLLSCAKAVKEHLVWLNFVHGPNLPDQHAKDRLHTVCSGHERISEKLKEIEAFATKTNNYQLLAMLHEEFGYGILVNW